MNEAVFKTPLKPGGNRQPAPLRHAAGAELEQLRVDVIVTHAAATLPVAMGQHRVPVVYELSADPRLLIIAAFCNKICHKRKNPWNAMIEARYRASRDLHQNLS